MIIKSLYDYYNILMDDPDFDIPLSGFSIAKINFVAKISLDGELLDIVELGEGKKRFVEVKVPEQKKRSSGIFPYFLSDNFKYVFGWDFDPKKSGATEKNFEAFKELNLKILKNIDTLKSNAMKNYLNNWNCVETLEHPEIKKQLEVLTKLKSGNVLFRLDGEKGYINDDPEIQKAWGDYFEESQEGVKKAQCLVSGKESAIEKIHPNIKGVRDANSTGAALVGFNADSFVSYNKTQGDNAPVSKEVAFAYTTVLNYMLNTNSDYQRVQIGDATTVFWAEDTSGECENLFGELIDDYQEDTEVSKKNDEKKRLHDSKNTKYVKQALEELRAGKEVVEKKDTNFYILGLSPNNARLSVRYWQKDTFGNTVDHIWQHYRDCEIVKFENETRLPTIGRLLYETISEKAMVKKSEPALSTGIMKSVFHGSPYPYVLYTAILRHIKTDKKINHLRCGFIKGYLIRNTRKNKNIEGEAMITMALNEENSNVAYRLGRLFAVLEKAQGDAFRLESGNEINSTIKDKYFGSASTSPRYVFPVLIKLSRHHISKFKQTSWKVKTEQRIQEILETVPEIPAYLNSEEQGMFILGYYHQRMDLYKKNEKTEEQVDKTKDNKLFKEEK